MRSASQLVRAPLLGYARERERGESPRSFHFSCPPSCRHTPWHPTQPTLLHHSRCISISVSLSLCPSFPPVIPPSLAASHFLSLRLLHVPSLPTLVLFSPHRGGLLFPSSSSVRAWFAATLVFIAPSLAVYRVRMSRLRACVRSFTFNERRTSTITITRPTSPFFIYKIIAYRHTRKLHFNTDYIRRQHDNAIKRRGSHCFVFAPRV